MTGIDNSRKVYSALMYLSNKSSDTQLGSDFWNDKEVKAALQAVKRHFPFSERQVVLFSLVCAFTLGRGGAYLQDIGSKLNVNPFELFGLGKDLDLLVEKGFVSIRLVSEGRNVHEYYVDERLLIDLFDATTDESQNVVHPLPQESRSDMTLILPDSIEGEELIYPDETKKEVQCIDALMSKKNLFDMSRPLKLSSLLDTLRVLFYGGPGMGKTATALQLCKMTGRSVVMLNLALNYETRFANDSKILEDLFVGYQKLTVKMKPTPVLLITHLEYMYSHSSDRNSILREGYFHQLLNTCHGIVICTINTEDDKLPVFSLCPYQIHFLEPDKKTKEALLKLKLGKYLDDDDFVDKASNYSINGNMLNVVLRKLEAYDSINQRPTRLEIEKTIRRLTQ